MEPGAYEPVWCLLPDDPSESAFVAAIQISCKGLAFNDDTDGAACAGEVLGQVNGPDNDTSDRSTSSDWPFSMREARGHRRRSLGFEWAAHTLGPSKNMGSRLGGNLDATLRLGYFSKRLCGVQCRFRVHRSWRFIVIYIDVSDLIRLLDQSGRPIGTARVSLEVSRELRGLSDVVRIIGHDDSRGAYCHVPLDAILAPPIMVVDKAKPKRLLGRPFEPTRMLFSELGLAKFARLLPQRWLRLAKELLTGGQVPRVRFGAGDILVRVGGSWTNPSSLMTGRLLQENFGVRVVQVIYDLLPITHPEYVETKSAPRFTDFVEQYA